MAYHKNWRKRKAEVLAIAEDSSSSEDVRQLLGTSSSEEDAASLSPSADDIHDMSIMTMMQYH